MRYYGCLNQEVSIATNTAPGSLQQKIDKLCYCKNIDTQGSLVLKKMYYKTLLPDLSGTCVF